MTGWLCGDARNAWMAVVLLVMPGCLCGVGGNAWRAELTVRSGLSRV